MVEFRNVSLSFGSFNLFQQLDFRIEKNTASCLLGPSGCGKTTLLNMITRSVLPDSGEVSVDGMVSCVFQDSRLLPWETVRENAAYAMIPAIHRRERLEKTDAMLELLELSDAAGRFPGEISGGMARRTALARALLAPHEILLLDEPLSSLDPEMRERIIEVLKPRLSGKTVVLVTHDYDTAAALSDNTFRFSLPPVKIAAVDQSRLKGTLDQIEKIEKGLQDRD
jgi:ABC-type nitrate/sulfonate/bicarbonate transport system ATPase subunit